MLMCVFVLYLIELKQRGRSAEQMSNEMAPPLELDVQNGSIYAKVTLQRGFQFGPYSIKWTNDPKDKNVAWEVSQMNNSHFSSFYNAQHIPHNEFHLSSGFFLRMKTILKEITPRIFRSS